jgi:probable selenium-dependent hydroxylase accessory protein YqeC
MDPDHKVIHSIIEKHVKKAESRRGGAFPLIESLDLKSREVISLVGAGGKTTLMFRLAKELIQGGKRVITTTTTKILEPSPDETECLFVESNEEKLKEWVRGHVPEYKHMTLARERLGTGKLKGISPALALDLWDLDSIDYLIIEADGAAGRPVKAPREGEPVIPSNTTLVVAMLGVDGAGKELNGENVFQAELISTMTGIRLGRPLTEEALSILVTHPRGIFKGTPSFSRVIVFLNKVDISEGVQKAERIAEKILEKKNRQIERVVLGQLKKDPPVVEVMFPK